MGFLADCDKVSSKTAKIQTFCGRADFCSGQMVGLVGATVDVNYGSRQRRILLPTIFNSSFY